jgi:hypothetical protein
MKNYADLYLDEDFDEDTESFEKFGRRGKLEPKEGQRPRRNAAQETIKAQRRKKEAEKERAIAEEDTLL